MPIRPGRSHLITSYGAVADNRTLSHTAISRAVAAASAAGGGYVVVPEGVFLTGSVSLATNVYLVLEPGAVLQGSANPLDYNRDWDYWHVVQGINCSNTGVIASTPAAMGGELRGAMWQMIKSYDAATGYTQTNWEGVDGCQGECRPKNLAFIDVENVTVAGVTLADSSDWTQLFRRCRHVLEDRVVVRGDWQWGNNDGLDVESGYNLTFSNSVFSTGDDCLAFRSGNCNSLRTPWPLSPDGEIAPLSRVRVRNMTLTSSSAAVKVEALFQRNHGDVSDMVFQDVRIVKSNRGIGVWQRVGNGSLHGLRFNNFSIDTQYMPMPQFWGSAEAIVVTSIPADGAAAAQGLKGIHDVHFSNIVARSEQGALFAALGNTALSAISLSNVSITVAATTSIPANVSFTNKDSRAVHDYWPLSNGAPVSSEPAAPVDGITVRGAATVMLDGVSVAFAPPHRVQWNLQCANYTAPAQTKGNVARCLNYTMPADYIG